MAHSDRPYGYAAAPSGYHSAAGQHLPAVHYGPYTTHHGVESTETAHMAFGSMNGQQPNVMHHEHMGFADEQGLQDDSYAEDSLKAVKDLPACFRPLFPNFRYFNPVQSEAFDVAYGSDTNMVVSAPTGSGKTGVMELAMLRLLYRHIQSDGQLLSPKGRTKIIYLAPIRALVQERVADWGNRFGLLGLLCMELSGDADAERADLEAADIICTTPEKFDCFSAD
eukprot:jgi/Chrzof1/12765/Cz07g06210.t1